MKTDVILCGVGGQGILTIATIIGEAAMQENLYIKQSEVHGMSQRGGDVQSNLRISNMPIMSDLIAEGSADVIISMEPMEALRYSDMAKVESDLNALEHVIVLDIEQLAKDNGIARSANVILLGAAQKALGIELEKLEAATRSVFARKGEAVVEANLKALAIGKAAQR